MFDLIFGRTLEFIVKVKTYFWKGNNFVAALSKEGETVTADFLPNLGELHGELGAEPDPSLFATFGPPKLS